MENVQDLIQAFNKPQVNVVMCFVMATVRAAEIPSDELIASLTKNREEFKKSADKISDEALKAPFTLTHLLIGAADENTHAIYDFALPQLEYQILLDEADQGYESWINWVKDGKSPQSELDIFTQEIIRMIEVVLEKEDYMKLDLVERVILALKIVPAAV
ncbi:hypothetical protein ORJ66_21245 [Pseudoalteromonas tunicata]|uniref:hypothetical protein n=1 Tax=Pseudoalteromonas tunicata TaxID=314281 RepID=UPI00273DB105|nr:hypothetical protein [Pseudoalteromonas tunicata]MDP5215573.1 hypothetical protein [Pseudoalteromonas tunicata]